MVKNDENVVRVNTCLPPDLYLQASLNHLNLAECLRIGVKIKLGIDEKEDELEREERMLKAQLKHLEERKNGYKAQSKVAVKIKEEIGVQEEEEQKMKDSGLDRNGNFTKEKIAEIKAKQKFNSIHAGRLF